MDKMRDEFEKWAKSRGMNVQKSRSGSYYHIVATDNAWRAWQASRQALVVELPHTVFRGDYLQDGTSNLEWEEYFEIDEIKNTLKEAGIKWTE